MQQLRFLPATANYFHRHLLSHASIYMRFACEARLEKHRFLDSFFRFLGFYSFYFLGFMHEDRTQNYDPEIQEECIIHNTRFLLQITAYQ